MILLIPILQGKSPSLSLKNLNQRKTDETLTAADPDSKIFCDSFLSHNLNQGKKDKQRNYKQ